MMTLRHCLAALLLLALAACGQATSPAPSSETTASTETTVPPPPIDQPTSTATTGEAPSQPDQTAAPSPQLNASEVAAAQQVQTERLRAELDQLRATAAHGSNSSQNTQAEIGRLQNELARRDTAQAAPPPPPPPSGPTAAPSAPSFHDDGTATHGGVPRSATTEEQPSPGSGQLAGETTTEPATILCDEVGRRTTQAECDDFKQISQSAQQGQAAFNAPDPMQRGQKVTLQLAISYNPQSAQQPTPSQTVDSLPGETQAFTPQVGRFMAADLSGAGFHVRPLSSRTQEIMRGSVTTWEWEVTAVEGGSHTLTLRTVVEACPTPSTCVPLHSTTHDQSVNVKVDLVGQAQDLLQTIPTGMQLIAGLVAGIAALLSAFFGLRSALRKGRSET